MAQRVRDRVLGWDKEEYDKLTRKIQLSLLDCNLDKAISQLAAFGHRIMGTAKPALEAGDSVALLVEPESAGLLQSAGYDNISSVMYATDAELLRIKMFGSGRLKKLRAALAEHKFAPHPKTAVLIV